MPSPKPVSEQALSTIGKVVPFQPWLWFGIAVVVFLLDQITKQWVSGSFQLYETDVVTSFFQLTLRHNYGVAFSMFADGDGWQRWFFSVLAGGVSIGLVVWIAKLHPSRWIESLALALVLGGALGNLYDRALLGYVVDFLLVHYKEHQWPAFNVADMAISGGAVLLIYDAIFGNANNTEKDNE